MAFGQIPDILGTDFFFQLISGTESLLYKKLMDAEEHWTLKPQDVRFITDVKRIIITKVSDTQIWCLELCVPCYVTSDTIIQCPGMENGICSFQGTFL